MTLPYEYENAGQLLEDFWRTVNEILRDDEQNGEFYISR